MKSNNFEMKDSGARQEFETGAVRDLREGKGRYDLVSPFALKRLAVVYEKGAKKYADRNWEKGMPHTRYLDSAIRHLNQYLQGDTDEDHLGHAAWNVFAIMHMQETHPELDDRPKWFKELTKNEIMMDKIKKAYGGEGRIEVGVGGDV